MKLMLLVACVLARGLADQLLAQAPQSQPASRPAGVETRSKPFLLRQVPLGDYGSKFFRFGDLDGDGVADALMVQAKAPEGQDKCVVTCLTAMTLEGKILWQVGQPDPANLYFGNDYAVQIHDWDNDGRNEVIYIPDNQNMLTVLEGRTGKVLRTQKVTGGHNAILFADLAGKGWPSDVIAKDFYENFAVYDRDLKLLWSKHVNPGHYPIEYDFDGDGRDELLCGYTLYDHDGREIWSHPEFPEHNDATYIEDMNGDGKPEIAIATSVDAVLLDMNGKVLFRKPMDHCQHALIGKFRPDLPGKQVYFISRMHPKPGEKFHASDLTMFTYEGQQLWSEQGNIWSMGGEVIDNWTGRSAASSRPSRPHEQFVGLYSRGYDPPVLIDGRNQVVATFPFPPAITQKGAGPGGRDIYDDYYMQHLDCHGDEREEILIFNHKALWIYTNIALWPKPRLYNNTYYPGRL